MRQLIRYLIYLRISNEMRDISCLVLRSREQEESVGGFVLGGCLGTICDREEVGSKEDRAVGTN